MMIHPWSLHGQKYYICRHCMILRFICTFFPLIICTTANMVLRKIRKTLNFLRNISKFPINTFKVHPWSLHGQKYYICRHCMILRCICTFFPLFICTTANMVLRKIRKTLNFQRNINKFPINAFKVQINF